MKNTPKYRSRGNMLTQKSSKLNPKYLKWHKNFKGKLFITQLGFE